MTLLNAHDLPVLQVGQVPNPKTYTYVSPKTQHGSIPQRLESHYIL
jgi:hypothetical protein